MKSKTFKVRPKLAYKLLGTELQLDPEKIYEAIYAQNIPNWKERGLIFIGPDPGFLLEQNEYTIIK
jgi:hypothetical protein